MLTCRICEKEFPPTSEYFHRDKARKSGFHPYCKPCRYERRKKPRPTPEQRFWPKVDKTGNKGCWQWTSTLDYTGYGRFHVSPQQRGAMAHRYSYELHYGSIPEGFDCLHKCDNPACVNPDHLFLGTHQDNMTDMVKKGRVAKKLTKQDVLNIRQLYTSRKWRQKEIAKRYNVHQSHISYIVNYKYWKHIT